MSGKEQFVKLPRELLESDAFGSLGVNGFRFVRFLMIEHMRRGARYNGNLKAPQRQLVDFGIPPGCVTAAIGEAETCGLVECRRHGLRVATEYGLTWLRLHDGSEPSNAWREYRASAKPARSRPGNLPTKLKAGLPTHVKADRPNLPTDLKAEPSGNLPTDLKALLRDSYHGGGNDKEGESKGGGTEPLIPDDERQLVAGKREGSATDPARICGWYVTGPTGFRICQQAPLVGSERCPEHTRAPKAIAVPGKPNGAMGE